ncbi:MAG: prepilin-type N-terminal cleavage/methylation domain-containing protein [Saccharofermentans sp.]|nr:prepilin-type N-terminal cleavage/methylation domain-containing protein [Saccharofermentans sp.]
MKKINKNKHGFTLTEMILVVAIIIILASAIGIGVADIINAGKRADAQVNKQASTLRANINNSEAKLTYYGF